ncbi:hypothetical protein DAI22_03g165800 [Oryza sativa Japonica Group]|nr:hypothetical protein DAI22_03g165800 [Oryza sativa Japonica Group]
MAGEQARIEDPRGLSSSRTVAEAHEQRSHHHHLVFAGSKCRWHGSRQDGAKELPVVNRPRAHRPCHCHLRDGIVIRRIFFGKGYMAVACFCWAVSFVFLSLGFCLRFVLSRLCGLLIIVSSGFHMWAKWASFFLHFCGTHFVLPTERFFCEC